MLESAHPAILNRSEAIEHAKEHYSGDLEYLKDLVNYGTNLIIRTLGDGGDDIEKHVVCGALLKHVVGMLDACVTLLESGSATPAFLQVRSAFEATLYIELILKKQPAERARTYSVGEYRRRRSFAMHVLDGSDDPGSFNAKYASIGMRAQDLDDFAKSAANKEILDVNQHLSRSPLDAIDRVFETKRRNRRTDPTWYQCLGFESLYQVAKNLDQVAAYEVWYTRGSSLMHADSFSQQVIVHSGKGILKPIRNLEEAHQLCGAIGQLGLRSYRIVLQHFRPLELAAFRRKYIEDWRGNFRSSKKIEYVYE